MNGGRGQIPLGRVVGVPVLLDRSWVFFGLLILVLYGPRVQQWVPDTSPATAYAVAAVFAVLLCASVLVHELAHAVAGKRLGLGVERITLSLLGGATHLTGEERTPGHQAIVSGAGPLASLGLGGACLLLSDVMEPASLGQVLVAVLGACNTLVGLFNLLPGLPLDGGQLLRAAVWKVTGDIGRATVVAAWSGMVVGLVVLGAPVVVPLWRGDEIDPVSLVWGLLLGGFLVAAARGSLTHARVAARVSRLRPTVLARPAIGVTATTPLSAALEQARVSGARALVVVDEHGRAQGLVSGPALAAVPPDRLAVVTAAEVSRRLEPGMVVPLGIEPYALLAHLRDHAATEYLLVDADGQPAGVLAESDVRAALEAP